MKRAEHTVISFRHLRWSSTFFPWREFSNDMSQKMSTNGNSSHFHHIFITFNIVMKLWCKCDSYIFLLNHIINTFVSQCGENVLCLNFVVTLWFTFPSHFYHNVRKMCCVNILWWKCDAEVNATRNMPNHKSAPLL